jgi:hypothetical protein
MLKVAQLRKIIVPSPPQAAACLVMSVGIMAAVYADTIGARFSGKITITDEALKATLKSQFDQFLNSEIIRTGTLILFWGAIGLIGYTIVWVLMNAIIEARNEVVIESSYTNRGSFLRELERPLWQIGFGLILIIWLLLAFRFIYPIWLDWAGQFIAQPSQMQGWLMLAGAIAGSSVSIYIAWTLGQIVYSLDIE